MIFTHLYIDNLYSFSDTEIDFTIKREIKDSTIEGEYLQERPNFRFKRVCIFSGANASGKTSLGKILNYIQLFIGKPYIEIGEINDKDKPATLKVEFVLPQTNTIHYLFVKRKASENPVIEYAYIPILEKDTANSARKRLYQYVEKQGQSKITGLFFTNKENTTKKYDFEDIKPLLVHSGFYYLYSDNSSKNTFDSEYLTSNILESILKTFDDSIISVKEILIDDSLDGYSIHFANKDKVLVSQDGDVTNANRLSKGTYDAIQVANFVAVIIAMERTSRVDNKILSLTYFLDEKMAYTHSELEQTIVNLIIQKMGRYSQFFYTTHNYDILDMNLPVHSYAFLRKEDGKAKFVQPEHQFKKNDRSLLNYVQNDVFNTLPDTGLLDDLLFAEE